MGGVLPTEDNIQMSGPGFVGRDTSGAGLSELLDASEARALLDLASVYQPLDSDLTAIAALTTTSFGRALLTLADASAARTAIGAGTSSFDGAFASLTGKPTTLSGYGITDAQPLDSDLTAIAALATTSFGRSLLELANAAAGLSTLGAQAALVSGTNIKTVNSTSLLGSGNIAVGSKGFRAVSGHYYATHGLVKFSDAVALAANTLYLMPFRHPTTETWTKIWTYVQVAGSGGTARLGIYCPDDSGDGLSATNATLISDCGTVSVASIGTKEITGLSVSIDAGKIYWLAIVADTAFSALGAAISTSGNAQGSDLMTRGMDTSFNFNQVTRAQKAQTYGALPATVSSLVMTGAAIPAIGLRL